MKRKNCLVIGANSFVGSYLVKALKASHHVTAVYNNNKDRLDSEVTNVSMTELDTLSAKYDDVYIVSAYIHTGKIDSTAREWMYKINVALVADICSRFPDAKFIYCSSVSVYSLKNGVIHEHDAEGGLNEYGISKLWGEKIILQTRQHAIVRFSSVYGTEMKMGTIIPNYITQGLKDKEITVYGEGARLQNYIHIQDAVNFLLSAADYKENGTFLACAPDSISNLQLATAIAEELKCKVVFKGEDRSPSFNYNNEKTVELLGYKPGISIKEGINQVVKWIEKRSW